MLTFYEDTDASEAFQEFHCRSAKAKKYLAALKSRPAEDVNVEPLVKDFNALREQFKVRPTKLSVNCHWI